MMLPFCRIRYSSVRAAGALCLELHAVQRVMFSRNVQVEAHVIIFPSPMCVSTLQIPVSLPVVACDDMKLLWSLHVLIESIFRALHL